MSTDLSVGVITPQVARFDQPLSLDCGKVLPTHELIYETYGELNAEKSNAILVCHALSGESSRRGQTRR